MGVTQSRRRKDSSPTSRKGRRTRLLIRRIWKRGIRIRSPTSRKGGRKGRRSSVCIRSPAFMESPLTRWWWWWSIWKRGIRIRSYFRRRSPWREMAPPASRTSTTLRRTSRSSPFSRSSSGSRGSSTLKKDLEN